MYPQLHDENKLLLVDRFSQNYHPASYIPTEYLHLIIPYAGLYYEQDPECDVLSQHMTLGPFSLWLHDIFAKKDIVLCPYAPFHLWALHFMYEDSLRAESLKTNEFLLEERECNLFNLYSDLHRVPMPAGKKILSFHINILPQALIQMVQRFPALYYLASKKLDNVSAVINQRPYTINAVCNMLIQSILSCRMIERPAQHYLFRCCVDLFLNFAQQDAAGHEPMLFSSVVNASLFNSLFAYLTDNAHVQHSVPELAKKFGMEGAKLAQGFRQHFSIGITPFIKMNRMMTLYDRLIQGALPLPMLAEFTGYRNVQQMITEVEEYYSCDIRELRRAT